MFYTTRHNPNGRYSHTYPAHYGLLGGVAKLFAVACVPMLLADLSIHKTCQQNLSLLALAAPGLIIVMIWCQITPRMLAVAVAAGCRHVLSGIMFLWRWRRPRSLRANVLKFPRGGR